MKKSRLSIILSIILLVVLNGSDPETFKEVTHEEDTLDNTFPNFHNKTQVLFDLDKAVPGTLKLSNEYSFPLMIDSNGEIIAAGSIIGSRRLIAFTHGCFFTDKVKKQKGLLPYMIDSFLWVGNTNQLKIGMPSSLDKFKSALEEYGIEVVIKKPQELRGNKLKNTKERINAYFFLPHEIKTEEDIERIIEFSKSGGALVMGATPWAFQNKYQNFENFPGNRILKQMGIVYMSNQTAKKPFSTIHSDPKGFGINAAQKILKSCLINPITLQEESLIDEIKKGRYLSGKKLIRFLNLIDEIEMKIGGPSLEHPINLDDLSTLSRLRHTVVLIRNWANQTLPAKLITKIPSSDEYPGSTPLLNEEITHTLMVNGQYQGWLPGRKAGSWKSPELRSIGLYAPAGKVIKIAVPERVVNQGVKAIIGSYKGSLLNKKKLKRYPQLCTSFYVDQKITEIANGLGGLIYLSIPSGVDLGNFNINVKGAIKAPFYEHGTTDLEEWRNEISKRSAPWAELVSKDIILTLPSVYVRQLKNPNELMDFWMKVMETSAILGGFERKRVRAERIVFDRQISAGWMHSGYPIAAHIGKDALQAVNYAALKERGNWGFFHELGHNHQHDLWSLPGTVETTCNLWSLFLFEKLIGKESRISHPALSLFVRKKRLNSYFENGKNFKRDWKVWTALETYMMIQEEFGWEPFKKVFQRYNELPEADWPVTQQEKNDLFVILMSIECGKDLSTFWKMWNFPLGDKVEAKLSNLPNWEKHPIGK